MGYAPFTLSNRDLTWETTEQYNLGLDFGLFKGRISGAIELYSQHTYNLLMSRKLPEVTGFDGIIDNIGETRNKGIEVSLTTTNVHSGKFIWITDLTFGANKEEITLLATGLDEDISNNWFVGYPIDTYYDNVAAPTVWGYSREDMEEMALFNEQRSDFEPGDLRLLDLNNDYLIGMDDREIRGSKMPKLSVSMANTFTYGPFDLYLFMYGSFGQTIYWDPV